MVDYVFVLNHLLLYKIYGMGQIGCVFSPFCPAVIPLLEMLRVFSLGALSVGNLNLEVKRFIIFYLQ